MNKSSFAMTLAVSTWTLAAIAVGAPHARQERVITGASQTVGHSGGVKAWEKLDANGKVTAVGVDLPISVVENPPDKPGTGPCGAVAVLAFPREAQQTTYFNHFEMQWNPHGHPPACCFGVPHFDLHFYGVPVADVSKIGPGDTAPPTAERLPAGFFYPGVKECVPQMGVHAVLPEQVGPGHVMTADMIAGFYHGKMHFVEPMITRAFLMKKQSFKMDVPMPKTLGRATSYPTKFEGIYDTKKQAYSLVFSEFKAMQ